MAGSWKHLTTVSITSAGDEFTSADGKLVSFAAADQLKVIFYIVKSGTGDMTLFPNGDESTSNSFTAVYSKNGNSISPNNNHIGAHGNYGGLAGNTLATYNITNIDGQEKIIKWDYTIDSGSDAGSVPDRFEAMGKYSTSSNAQITSLSAKCGGGAGGFGVGSYITVWGSIDDTVTDEKTTLTNIPANTRYEETVTRKIYRRTAEPTANPSYNFSSDSGWTQVGSTVAISSNALRATTVNTNSDDRIYKALGYTLSNSKWVCRFEVTPSSSNYVSIITLSAGTNTLNAYDTIHVDYGSSKLKMREYNGSSMGLDSTGITTSTGTNYFVTLTRTGETGLKLDVRTGSHTGTLVGSETGTISSGTIGLDTFQSGAYGRQAGDATYVVDNVEIYDGVTSTDAQWIERGSA